MNEADVQRWLDRYIEAWQTYDPDLIGDLFAEDATYRYHPWETEPVRGRGAIVDDWLANPDVPGSWHASYRPLLVSGHRAVTTGESRYEGGATYENLWVLSFDDDGRCSDFVEWFMKNPRADGGAGG